MAAPAEPQFTSTDHTMSIVKGDPAIDWEHAQRNATAAAQSQDTAQLVYKGTKVVQNLMRDTFGAGAPAAAAPLISGLEAQKVAQKPQMDAAAAADAAVVDWSDPQAVAAHNARADALTGRTGTFVSELGPSDLQRNIAANPMLGMSLEQLAALDVGGQARAGMESNGITNPGFTQGKINLDGVGAAIRNLERGFKNAIPSPFGSVDLGKNEPTGDALKQPIITLPQPSGDSIPAGIARGLAGTIRALPLSS